MSEIVDIAYKFGGGRYFQGQQVLELVGNELTRFGKKAYILGGPTALALTKDRLLPGLEVAGVSYHIHEYTGFCCYNAAQDVKKEAAALGCDIILGIGGGRIMDLAKLCGDVAGLPVVTIPTSMATCAAYTTLSVLYDENGKTVGNYYLETEVSAIFVDEDIMAGQPVRLVAAGVMDALAKYIEIKNGHKEVESDKFAIDLMTAAVLARHTYDSILENWEPACQALQQKTPTEALKNLLFLCIPVTGMISGISKGFGQSALGHELYYQLRTNFTKEALSYLHGEVVAIGLLTQLHYNGTPELIDVFRGIMQDMGMPVTLDAIGIVPNKDNFDLLYANMIKSPFVTNTDEKEALFRDALRVIINPA